VPETTGVVRCVRVGDDFGFTTIQEQPSNTRETFILWWGGVSTPADPPVHVRIVQSDWVALLRQSLSDNTGVTITHDTNSAIVLNVQLGA